MVFLKQIEVCNTGQEFVNGWVICFLVVGAVFVGVVWLNVEVHAFHGVDSVFSVVFSALFN